MAKVILRQDWYGPSAPYTRQGIAVTAATPSFSGQYFHSRGGEVIDIPDDLVPYLPTSAKLLDADGNVVARPVSRDPVLTPAQKAEKAAEAMARVTKEADELRDRVRVLMAERDAKLVVVDETPVAVVEDEPPVVTARRPRTGG